MLDLYSQCLHKLGKTEDYVRIALRTLAKTIRSAFGAVVECRTGPSERPESWPSLSSTNVNLKDIIATSASLDQLVSAPMDPYFDNIRLDPYIRHSPDHDGFTMTLRLRSLINEDFTAESVQARLISFGEEQRSELWLTAEGSQMIKPGMARVTLKSNVRSTRVSRESHLR